MKRKFMVLDSVVKAKKTDSKILKWEATCQYMINDERKELKSAIGLGTTKAEAIADAVSWAYKKAIDETYEAKQ